MPVNHIYCFITMKKPSSSPYKEPSLRFSALVEFFQIGFLKWVSGAQSFFFRLWFLPQVQHAFEWKNQDLEFLNQRSLITEKKHRDELCREDIELVMESLGLFCIPESERLQESYSYGDLSTLFEEKEPSLGEVRDAFDVFDENKDGFIDATELKRVLIILGLNEGSNLENCKKMIRLFDENKDERIDFQEFMKLMESSFL